MGGQFRATENREDGFGQAGFQQPEGNVNPHLPPEGDGEPQIPQEVDPIEYEALKQENEKLQHRMQVLANQMMSPEYIRYLEAQRSGISSQVYGGHQPPQPPPQEPEVDNFNPEEASQKELVEYITKKVASLVDQRVGEVDNRIQQQEYMGQLQAAERDMQATAQKYPDFFTYRTDMMDIARRHPTVTAEEAYLLAKSARGGFRQPTQSNQNPNQNVPRQPQVPRGGARPGGVSTRSTAGKEDFSTYDDAIKEAMKEIGLI